MPSHFTLTVESDRGAERTAELARELMGDLARTPGLEVSAPPERPRRGMRGLPMVALGEFLVTVLAGAAGNVLLDCLKAYLHRDRALVVRLRRPDGAEITLDAAALAREDAGALTKQLEGFLSAGAAPRDG
jgi:membrane-associated two-gene conflict system component 1 (EACC1)